MCVSTTYIDRVIFKEENQQKSIEDTLFQTMFVACSLHIYQEEKEHGVVWLKITGNLLTLCFGSCGRELLGAIFRLTMVIGAIPIADLSVGEIREFGKNYWKFL